MKPTTIHPLSVILGGVAVAGLFLAISAQEVNRRSTVEIPAIAFGDTPINVVGIPLPSDYHNLQEADHTVSTPFLVGSDEIFIVTAIGTETGGGPFGKLTVDGVLVLTGGGPGVLEELPRPGFIVPSASSMVLGDENGNTLTGRVWGYVLRE